MRETVLVVNPFASLSVAPTEGVALFERCAPVHGVLLGPSEIDFGARRVRSTGAIAIPANTSHAVRALPATFAGVAYLDARRYRFEDAERLAATWRGFVPGRDDLREAMGDACRVPERRVDVRVRRALEALEHADRTVVELADLVGVSESRMTHLFTDTVGAPPRAWRAWFRLRRALHEAVLGDASLTRAAHRAGFADSAHLTRTCKRLTGVRPAQMLPDTIHLVP